VRLNDLLDISVLRTLAEANYKASGMPIGIIDAVDGAVLVGFGWQDVCTLYHRVHAISAERCRESDDHIKHHVAGSGPCEYTCRNGLRDIGVPIRVDSKHLATLFLGQFFYEGESPDRAFFRNQAQELGFEESAYLAAVERVPVFSRAVVENILAYNSALARVISELAEGALRRKRAEARAEFLARFPQENPDPVLRVASDLTLAYANDAARSALRDLGIEPGAVAPPAIAELARRALAERRRVQGDLSSDSRYFSLHLAAVGDEVNVYAHDITERVRADEALRQRDNELRGAMERLESLLENSPLAVIEWSSVDFRITRWSDEATRLFGWSAQETVGKRIDELDLVYPADWPLVEQVMTDMLSGRRPRNVNKNRNVRSDGTVVHCEWYNSTVSDSSGKLASVLSLVLDVTQRKRVEEELREANRAKDEFLGMLSHELRNPLAPIRNSLHILDHAEPAGQLARRAKVVANRQLTHLTRLVDDLLDVTRIVRGKTELRLTRVDLAQLARRTGEDYRALMHERGLDFVVETPGEPAWVDGDETRLAQVIGNLLQNAAKFTPQGGRVNLYLAVDGDTVEVRVNDTGLGIERDLLPRVFDPFVQAKQSLARTEGGLGLGLALVKGLVELHNGSVAVASGGLNLGAQFTVRIPALPSRCAPTERAAAEAPVMKPSSQRVLVVDDNRDAATSLAEFVEMLGHDVDVAFDGPSAVEAAMRKIPDVVLCDIGLPGMSGYDVARRLREDQRFDRVRLVAVTGYAEPEDRKRAFEAGFEDHVSKPPDLARVERLLVQAESCTRSSFGEGE
jgi:PAS domain S-box-containing protein